MSEKLGRLRIKQLIDEAVKVYENETGIRIPPKKTLENWSGLAAKLSEFSKQYAAEHPNKFGPASTQGEKYIVTEAQVRNAYFEEVESLKEPFYQACNLYVYNRLGIEEEIVVEPQVVKPIITEPGGEKEKKKQGLPMLVISSIVIIALLILVFMMFNHLETLKRDMKILPYQPTKVEIDKLAGVWMAYTGSPQVRKSNPNRYHMTVPNVISVKYIDNGGYFTFDRYGPDFNQIGYMQFEGPNLVSMHSYLIDTAFKKTVPKLSLIQLQGGQDTVNVISSSWNFDSSDLFIIGIREVFIKKGGGEAKQITNSIKNMGGMGAVIHWQKTDNKIETIRLQNQILDSLPVSMRSLLDESSIVLKDPDSTALLKKLEKRQEK